MNTNLRIAFEDIRAESNGSIEINLFPDGQLGGDSDMLTQVRSGALELHSTAGIIITALAPAVGIINVPFAFKDYSVIWPAMDSDLGTHVRDAMSAANLHVFETFWDNGYRQITSLPRPIHSPDDLHGLKIRVPSSPINAALFSALGASPTVLNASEIYTALQTHIVDCQENPLVTINAYRIYEVQKYCALSNHLWDGIMQVANPQFWEKLPAEVQDIITRHVNAAALRQRVEVFEANQIIQQQLKEKGLEFNDIDTAAFRDVLARTQFYTEWRQKYGDEAWVMLEKHAGPLG
jgi:TRAP-type transport system periplasmic protein